MEGRCIIRIVPQLGRLERPRCGSVAPDMGDTWTGTAMEWAVSDYRTCLVVLACAALLAGCGDPEGQAGLDDTETLEATVAELDETVAQKDAQLTEIADALAELEEANAGLREAVEAAGGDMGSLLSPRLEYSNPSLLGTIDSTGPMDKVAEAAAGVEAATEKLKEAAASSEPMFPQ